MTKFDPNAAAAADSGVFGLPFDESESAIVLIPVPWEATTSYGGGTSAGPSAILEASHQVDLFDLDVMKPYTHGIFMRPEQERIRQWNRTAKKSASAIIDVGGRIDGDARLEASLKEVNDLGAQMNEAVYQETKQVLSSGKIAALVGGDHSVPFGAFKAVAEKHPSYGLLHFDAHSDTRKAYEGFTWSHASIMHNALERIAAIKKLVQVGIRDICEEEVEYVATQGNRVEVFYDRDLQRAKFEGRSWSETARRIVDALPKEVWVTFDIDGLDPRFCPNTGTPVPGGLDFQEANFILGEVVRSGRTIIGFDLNEVAPSSGGEDEWDANVGARMLYKLCAWTLASQGKAELRS